MPDYLLNEWLNIFRLNNIEYYYSEAIARGATRSAGFFFLLGFDSRKFFAYRWEVMTVKYFDTVRLLLLLRLIPKAFKVCLRRRYCNESTAKRENH